MDAEAGETEIALDVRHRLIAEGEHRGRIDDREGRAVLHLEDVDAMCVVEAAVEELQPERQLLLAPERVIRREADHAVLVVGQVLERVGQLVVRRLVGLLREFAREHSHRLSFERRTLVLRVGGADHRVVERPPGERQREAGGKKVAAAQGHAPVT